jgi:hypothetical protein
MMRRMLKLSSKHRPSKYHSKSEGEKMKFMYLCAFVISTAVGMSACNKAESPDKVQANVEKAASEAAANDAKADADRKQAETQANEDMAKAKAEAQTQAVDKSISAVADQAVTEAEGQTKVALAKCQALEGDAQKQCKDQANAHLQTVKDRAKAAKDPDKGTEKAAN